MLFCVLFGFQRRNVYFWIGWVWKSIRFVDPLKGSKLLRGSVWTAWCPPQAWNRGSEQLTLFAYFITTCLCQPHHSRTAPTSRIALHKLTSNDLACNICWFRIPTSLSLHQCSSHRRITAANKLNLCFFDGQSQHGKCTNGIPQSNLLSVLKRETRLQHTPLCDNYKANTMITCSSNPKWTSVTSLLKCTTFSVKNFSLYCNNFATTDVSFARWIAPPPTDCTTGSPK